MTRCARSALLLFLASGVVILILPGRAWPCVPQPLVSFQPAAFAAAGAEVTVLGENFPGATEIRWNALDGPQLASAPDGLFSVKVRIPGAPGGLYTVLALSRGQDGVVRSVGRAPFFVTGATGAGSAASAGVTKTAPVDRSLRLGLFLGIAVSLGLVGVGGFGVGAISRHQLKKGGSASALSAAGVADAT